MAKLVAIILGILAVIVAAPMVSKVLRSSNEGATKGKLYQIREALTRYKKETGTFPPDLAALTNGGKHLDVIPFAAIPPHHKDSSSVRIGSTTNDEGGWLYGGSGDIWVNCTHTDTKHLGWSGY